MSTRDIVTFLSLRLCLSFPAIDAPGGFLFEWWSVFWDIFIARTNEKHSEVAASYIEVSKVSLSFSTSTSAKGRSWQGNIGLDIY